MPVHRYAAGLVDRKVNHLDWQGNHLGSMFFGLAVNPDFCALDPLRIVPAGNEGYGFTRAVGAADIVGCHVEPPGQVQTVELDLNIHFFERLVRAVNVIKRDRTAHNRFPVHTDRDA